MKKVGTLLLVLLLLVPALSLAESCTCPCAAQMPENETLPALTGHAATAFDAVRYCNALPKNAHVISAAEYICKIEGIPVRLLLINASQSEFTANHFGTCAGIVIVDLDTLEVYDHTTLSFWEGEPVTEKKGVLELVYSHFDSHLMNGTEWIVTDSEILFPLSDDEIQQINLALQNCFSR
ncbi:MAG: hypothetical protein IKT57_01505 [Clostridia bacterium]|nr:hypothetical protein [Clostridia bacterium]